MLIIILSNNITWYLLISVFIFVGIDVINIYYDNNELMISL